MIQRKRPSAETALGRIFLGERKIRLDHSQQDALPGIIRRLILNHT